MLEVPPDASGDALPFYVSRLDAIPQSRSRPAAVVKAKSRHGLLKLHVKAGPDRALSALRKVLAWRSED